MCNDRILTNIRAPHNIDPSRRSKVLTPPFEIKSFPSSVEFGTFGNHRSNWLSHLVCVWICRCGSHFCSDHVRKCNHLSVFALVGGKLSENLTRKFVTFSSDCLMYVRYLTAFLVTIVFRILFFCFRNSDIECCSSGRFIYGKKKIHFENKVWEKEKFLIFWFYMCQQPVVKKRNMM